MLNTLFEKKEYVLAIKNNCVNEQVKLENVSISKVKVSTSIQPLVDKLEYFANYLAKEQLELPYCIAFNKRQF